MSDISRRDMLRALTAGVAGSALLPLLARNADAHSLRVDRVGLQLYTVRNSLGKDVDRTIAAVAAAGIKEVEFAGYHDRSAAQWKTLLAQNGLVSPSAHVKIPATNELWKPHFEAANTIGHRWIVVPSTASEFRSSVENYQKLADRLNTSGVLAKAAGLRIAYHNHEYEFARIGKTHGYEVLMGAVDPSLVDMELDLYWAVKGGQDPLALINRWPGRFPLCHIKDAGWWPFRWITEVGAGTIDFGAILSRAKLAGFKHWYIEQDNPPDDIAAMTRSARYLSKLAPGGKAVVDTMPHF